MWKTEGLQQIELGQISLEIQQPFPEILVQLRQDSGAASAEAALSTIVVHIR
jgi:hypothetical protein